MAQHPTYHTCCTPDHPFPAAGRWAELPLRPHPEIVGWKRSTIITFFIESFYQIQGLCTAAPGIAGSLGSDGGSSTALSLL